MSYFEILNQINVNDKTENRNGLTYLSWSWAWQELKKRYPLSYYTVHENADGLMYHHDDKTAWVKTGVTVVDGDMSLEHIEYLPVMDFRNKSISVDSITSFDVNKAIQRSLTKAIARHGLGLYIYAGEDLPDGEEPVKESVVPMSKRLSSPVVKEPVKITMKVSPDELKQRLKEIKALQDQYKVTGDALKQIATELKCKPIDEQTAQEYADFLVGFQNRIQ